MSYNVRRLLLGALHAVCEGEVRSMELLVVDNASTDGSADAVANEFPVAILIRNDRNRGFGAASNLGIAQARGEFVLLLNPDVVVDRHCVDELARFLDDHPDAAAASPRLRRPDGKLDLASRRGFPTPAAALYRLTGLSRCFATSRTFNQYNLGFLPEDQVHEIDAGTAACLMVRRSALQAIGGFDTDFFMYGEDLDLCFRLKERGWKIFYVPSAVAVHEKGASSRQATGAMLWEFHRSMVIFHRKHYARRSPAPINALVVAGIWTRWALLRLRSLLSRSATVSP